MGRPPISTASWRRESPHLGELRETGKGSEGEARREYTSQDDGAKTKAFMTGNDDIGVGDLVRIGL